MFVSAPPGNALQKHSKIIEKTKRIGDEKSFNLGRLRGRSFLVWNLGMEDRAEKVLWCEHRISMYPASRQGMENHTREIIMHSMSRDFLQAAGCVWDSPRSESQLNHESVPPSEY